MNIEQVQFCFKYFITLIFNIKSIPSSYKLMFLIPWCCNNYNQYISSLYYIVVWCTLTDVFSLPAPVWISSFGSKIIIYYISQTVFCWTWSLQVICEVSSYFYLRKRFFYLIKSLKLNDTFNLCPCGDKKYYVAFHFTFLLPQQWYTLINHLLCLSCFTVYLFTYYLIPFLFTK